MGESDRSSSMEEVQTSLQNSRTAAPPCLPPPPSTRILGSLPPQPNAVLSSIDSHHSIESQTSMQSQSSGASLLSHTSTLGFLPSLARLFSDICPNAAAAIDHHCIATVRSDQGSHISSLVIVGDYLYAGSGSSANGSNSIRVLQKMSLKECAGFGTGYAPVKALVVADDRILSAHQDHRIRIWSRDKAMGMKRLRPKQVIEGDSHMRRDVLQATYAEDKPHKLLASMPTIRDYLTAFIPPKNYVQVRRHHKRLWIEHVDTISMLAVGGTASDPILYSASWDRTIKVWKLSDFKCIESFNAHDDAINALVVAPDGFLYTASADTKVKVWGRQGDGTKGEGQQQKQKQKHCLVASLEAHKSAVNALSLMKERHGLGSTLYSGGSDRGIVMWEREGGTQHMVARVVLRGHRNAVLCLTSMGNVLCSGSADRTIRVWRQSGVPGSATHSCVAVLQGHGGPVKCLSLSVDGERGHLLYSSSLDNIIKLWQLCGCLEDGDGKEEEGNGVQITKQASVISPWKYPSV